MYEKSGVSMRTIEQNKAMIELAVEHIEKLFTILDNVDKTYKVSNLLDFSFIEDEELRLFLIDRYYK